MLFVGILLCLFAGLAIAVAAALEKREGMAVGGEVQRFRLLAALVRRPWWLVAMGVSVAAWLAQAGGLTLVPIAAAATLLAAGRALLVVLGIRWLGERFGGWELTGVGLATVGAVAAATTAGGHAARPELSNGVQLAVGAGALLVAVAVTRRSSGVALGAGAGVLFAATSVYTKEIGDRVAIHGLPGIGLIVASPSLWVMLGFTVLAQSYLQTAFRQVNAATVSATNTAVSMNGLIVCGFVLYHEAFPHGAAGVVLVLGILASAAGASLLAFTSASPPPSGPPPSTGTAPARSEAPERLGAGPGRLMTVPGPLMTGPGRLMTGPERLGTGR
jgi:drug/metabolite transporter (DMT)-like permease